ncbi:MAG: hypothetical protein IJV50_11855 [Lachnospiraceae bacterium]|nr:hypothetical protein [Lachnospiraceae bacterium]
MKTVQEYLRELDQEQLITTYLHAHPIEYDKLPNMMDMTVREIRKKYKQQLQNYIDRLCGLKMKNSCDGQNGVLYVHRCFEDRDTDLYFSMVPLDELLEKGVCAQNYSYVMCDQAEIISFLVAETPLTQLYIYELLADVMFEASWFGFEQEYLEEERRKLEESAREIEEGRTVTHSLEELEKEFGIAYDHESPDEDALRQKVILAKIAYEKHSKENELNMIVHSIRSK